jgi:hypothetical protein
MIDNVGTLSHRLELLIGATALCFALTTLGPLARSQDAGDPQYH